MSTNNISKIIQTTKEANAILSKAGGVMIKSSFNTAKQIATLYKDVGIRAFSLGREAVKTTVSLTIDNQKEIIKTSSKAIKEAAKSIRENGEGELKTMTSKDVKNAGKKKVKRKAKKDITIDDLLD